MFDGVDSTEGPHCPQIIRPDLIHVLETGKTKSEGCDDVIMRLVHKEVPEAFWNTLQSDHPKIQQCSSIQTSWDLAGGQK